MTLRTEHSTQPFSSSITYHSMGNARISLLGHSAIVSLIHFRIAGRPSMWP